MRMSVLADSPAPHNSCHGFLWFFVVYISVFYLHDIIASVLRWAPLRNQTSNPWNKEGVHLWLF
jgi:hypothetical protein